MARRHARDCQRRYPSTSPAIPCVLTVTCAPCLFILRARHARACAHFLHSTQSSVSACSGGILPASPGDFAGPLIRRFEASDARPPLVGSPLAPVSAAFRPVLRRAACAGPRPWQVSEPGSRGGWRGHWQLATRLPSRAASCQYPVLAPGPGRCPLPRRPLPRVLGLTAI